jgi:hypothetical protein
MFNIVKWTYSVVFAYAMIIAMPAYAEGYANGRVNLIQSYLGHNGLLVQIGTGQINPDQCPGAAWYIYPDDSPRAQFVQSALLTAQNSGKGVLITIQGCYENYPRIVHITFPQ